MSKDLVKALKWIGGLALAYSVLAEQSSIGWREALIVFLVTVAVIGVLGMVVRWFRRPRWNRLAQSILPGETLVARGMVIEPNSTDRRSGTPAILVRAPGIGYRLVMPEPRGNPVVASVAQELDESPFADDNTVCILMNTGEGCIEFAPSSSPAGLDQPAYAQQVLRSMLANNMGVPLEAGPA